LFNRLHGRLVKLGNMLVKGDNLSSAAAHSLLAMYDLLGILSIIDHTTHHATALNDFKREHGGGH